MPPIAVRRLDLTLDELAEAGQRRIVLRALRSGRGRPGACELRDPLASPPSVAAYAQPPPAAVSRGWITGSGCLSVIVASVPRQATACPDR